MPAMGSKAPAAHQWGGEAEPETRILRRRRHTCVKIRHKHSLPITKGTYNRDPGPPLIAYAARTNRSKLLSSLNRVIGLRIQPDAKAPWQVLAVFWVYLTM